MAGTQSLHARAPFVLGSDVMRGPLLFTSLGFVAIAAVGWTWGWHEHRRAEGLDFLQKRITLLDTDNRRLARVLGDKQRAESAAVDRAKRAGIERTVAGLRALDFLQPVTYKEIPRTELPAILRQKLAQQVPDQEFSQTGVSMAALGLLPAGMDLKKTYLDLLGEQIGAFYDQHTAELFTFSGQGLDNAQNRVIMAHELTHALEDQHFHLARLPLEAKGNDDRALAASALVEGDATLVMTSYMVGDLSASALKDTLAGAFSSDIRQIAAAPRYLRETLLFPYLRGQEFCQSLYQSGGWDALAKAFRSPPASTAEIMHPERFIARTGETPGEVKFRAVSLLGAEPIGNNVLGEFGARQWLGKWLRDDNAAGRVAAGWIADRYLVYGDAKASSYVWKTVWSSQPAAAAFADAAAQCWRTRFGLGREAFAAETHQTEGSAALPNGHHLIVLRQAEEVTLIDAQDSRWENAMRRLIANDPTAYSQNDVAPR